MGRYTSDTDMCSEDDSSTSNSESNHRRRKRKDKATCKKRRSRQKKDVSTDSCNSSNDPDFDIRSSISNNFYSEDRRRRHRTTSKRKKKRRLQKRSFYGDSSSNSSDPDFNIRSSTSSDSDCDIRSRSCRSKSKREKSNGRMKKRFTNSSCSSDCRDTENSNSHTDSSTDREVSRKIVALAQELAELRRQLDVEKGITSNSQETEEELYWVDEHGNPICSVVDYTSWGGVIPLYEEESSWYSEEEVYYKRKRTPACNSMSDSEEDAILDIQAQESENDFPVQMVEELQASEADTKGDGVVENLTQLHRLLQVEPEEAVAKGLSLEVDYSEWILELDYSFTCSAIAAEPSFVQPLVIVAAENETEAESFDSECANEWLPDAKSNFSLQVNASHTRTTSELGESIVGISILFDAEEKPAEKNGKGAPQDDNQFGKKLLHSETTIEEKLEAEFMEEIGLLLRSVVEPQVDLKLEEKFLDSTTVGVEASRVAVRNHTKSTHGLTMKVWNPNSWEETTILSGILVTWKGFCTPCEVCTLDRGGGDPATNSHRKTFNSRRMEDRESISLQWRARYFGWLYDNCKGLLLDMLMWIGPFRAKEIV
ncbi:hypothetical protein R1sor_009021 [Riccia sorocarpa]|uniref:Uncharacterized protein n=1 Tax=Riccia sorocarpa TaxID=122646 RepID=A0ABD3H4K9_9MARC